MKGCLKTIGTIVFWGVIIIIGINTCDLITSPDTVISPEPNTVTSPQVSPSAPSAPAAPSASEPESIQIPSKELQGPTISLPTAIGGVAQSTEMVSMDYSWSYRGEWTWGMDIPVAIYDYYRELSRPPTKNYSIYVTHPLDDPYIDTLVEKLRKAAEQEGFSEYQTVEFAAAFVQSLPYTVDSVTTPYDEYPRYPLETLVDNGGDCEDTSILLASIIDKMGYAAVLIVLPNHVGMGVKGGENVYGTRWDYKGDKYYYLETTGENWGIGELPEEYKNASASIYPMIPVPILSHEGSINGRGYIAEVTLKVSNLGTAQANNVTVFAGFDAGDRTVWNSQTSEPFNLAAGQQVTVGLNLKVPLDKHTRLIVQIAIDGVLVDEDYTDWFDT
ncbi:hypothetical protein ACFLTR_00200 [Chloroflexota bacterium]